MKKHALLIGVNEYDNLMDLRFACQDASETAAALRENYGFEHQEITLMTDSSERYMRPSSSGGIESHFEEIIESNPNLDLLIFGFWGHGVFLEQQLYLCPTSASRNRIQQEALSMDRVKKLIAQTGAKNVFIILDCCQKRVGRGDCQDALMTESNQLSLAGAARDIGLAIKQQSESETKDGFEPNIAILNSCKEGQCAYEWNERRHGIFTAHLLDAFNRRLDTVSSIVDHIGNQVSETARKLGFASQRPFCQMDGTVSLPADMSKASQFGDVFICYRHKNIDLTVDLETELQRRGISYFIDKFGVLPGDEYSRIITRALGRAKVLLFLWTPDAEDSSDMPREIGLAQEYNLKIFPYMIGPFNSRQSKYAYSLAGLSRFVVDRQTPETINSVVDSLENLLNGKPAMQSPNVPPESLKNASQQTTGGNTDTIKQTTPRMKQNPQEETQRQERIKLRKPGTRLVKRIKGVEFAFRWCPAGTFMMGSPESEQGRYKDETQHKVTLTNGFWIMETEVTQIQWQSVQGDNPSHFRGDSFPVECVSWDNCQDFCRKCALLGLPLQLPTEAQWEYACRAGSQKPFFDGERISGTKANCDGTSFEGTNAKEPYLGQATVVRSYKPNAWNIYDMYGNVWEWCADWYGDYPFSKVIDPVGPFNGSSRVHRGGSWSGFAEHCRSACRGSSVSSRRDFSLGFRCILTQIDADL